MSTILKEFRCNKCNKLLYKYNIESKSNVTIEIKCPRCNEIKRYREEHQ